MARQSSLQDPSSPVNNSLLILTDRGFLLRFYPPGTPFAYSPGEMPTFHSEILRQQLLEDLERLHALILRCASGDRSAIQERDELEGAVQIKFALWRALPYKPR